MFLSNVLSFDFQSEPSMGLKPSKNWIKSVSACLCLPTPLYSSCLKEPPGWIAMLPRGYPSAHQDSRHSFSTSILVFIPNHAELVIGMVSIKLHFDNVGKITSQILSVTGLQDSEGLSGGLKAKGSAWLSHETEIDRISKTPRQSKIPPNLSSVEDRSCCYPPYPLEAHVQQ